MQFVGPERTMHDGKWWDAWLASSEAGKQAARAHGAIRRRRRFGRVVVLVVLVPVP